MDTILNQPQYDEYGLPLGSPGLDDTDGPSTEAIQKFLAGDFASFGMPVPSSMPTAAEAQKEARERSTEVLFHRKRLREILERHEDVLRKRWLKKTKSQRTAILLRVWSTMSLTHRPDYEALRKEGPELKTRGTRFRAAYIWPAMNVEDLVKGKSFLILLNSRGRNPPYVFAHADFEATRLGRVSGAIVTAFLNVHTIYLDGDEVESYGRLTSWQDDEKGMMKCVNGLAHQPGSALLILEIQQKILQFLVDCCLDILHDIAPIALINDFPIKPAPPLIAESSEWPTLVSMAAEAPYRLPAQLDFDRLRALIAAKRTGAEDHIRGLREDPGYFSDVLEDWSEHRQEKMLDTNAQRHPLLGRPMFWDRVIGSVVSDAYGALIVWDIISQQILHLSVLQDRYSGLITPQELLPPEYSKALLTLRYTLNQVKNGPIANLKIGIPASPPFRTVYVREPYVLGSSVIRVRSKVSQDDMMWLFNALWTDSQLMLLGLPGLMDEIEYFIQNDSKEKARLSPWVARVFSDLGLIARIQHELDIYQPWASAYEHERVKYESEIEKDFPQRFAKLAEVDRHLKGMLFSKLGAPIGDRFNYPSDKRQTERNINIMRQAEHNLDEFWASIDEQYRQKTDKSLDQTMGNILTKFNLERTPEWIEPIPETKSALPDVIIPHLPTTLSTSTFESVDVPSRFVPLQTKNRHKTRGPAQNDSSVTQNAPPLQEDTQAIFKLKARPYKVFRTLFFNPSSSDMPGEIPWSDFLYAMAAVGFAPEKLHGSVWQFKPLRLDVERSIQFHEPHPIGKIPLRYARRIGRRLARAYGWHGGMFVLE